MTAIAEDFVSLVRQVVPGERATLHEPVFGGNEKKYLLECIDSGYVSSVGQFVTRFEEDLATYVGSEHAIAVANGTVGLQLALVACGVRRHEVRGLVALPRRAQPCDRNRRRFCLPCAPGGSW